MIWNEGEILLCKRLKETCHADHWCDPGGKVDGGEHIEEAVIRECREETGLVFDKEAINLVDCFFYGEREIKTFIYETNLEFSIGDILIPENREPKKHSDWQWVSKRKL